MRNKVLAPVVVALGVLMLFGGFTSMSNARVTCAGKSMHNGDTCREYHRRSGRTTRHSYSEQRDNNHQSGLVEIGIGSVLTVGGIVWTVLSYRRRPGLPQGHPQPGGPGTYPPYPPMGGPSPGLPPP